MATIPLSPACARAHRTGGVFRVGTASPTRFGEAFG